MNNALVTEELGRLLPMRKYGFLEYVRNGIVTPGSAVVAPSWCADRHYGDCDVFANAIDQTLAASGSTDHRVMLINLPYRKPGESVSRNQLAHTIVTDGDLMSGLSRYWGYTPYDRLMAGQTGCIDINSLTFPLMIREVLQLDDFRERFADKIARAYAFINNLGMFEVTALGDHGPSALPVVAQTDLCTQGGPAYYDEDHGVLVEFAGLLGKNPDGRHIVGFKLNFVRDTLEGTPTHNESASWFFVIQLDQLKKLQAVVGGWNPSYTVNRLLSDGPDLEVDIRDNGSFHPESLAAFYNTAGEALYWLIMNTAIDLEGFEAGLKRIRQSVPPPA